MRRIALVFLCLVSFGCGTLGGGTPPGTEVAATIPAGPLDFGQPLDPSRSASIMEQALASIPAAEILGKKVVDEVIAAVRALQDFPPTSRDATSRKLALPARSTEDRAGGCDLDARAPFEKEGFGGQIAFKWCAETRDDRVVIDVQLTAQLQGTSPETLGQVLEVSFSVQGDQDACPTPAGKSIGTFSGRMYAYAKGASASYRRTATGLLDMEAYNAEDATLERADLKFEGSVNFEIDEQVWNAPFTSWAKSVDAKDRESTLEQLIRNTDGDPDPPAVMLHLQITQDILNDAMLGAYTMPLMPMIAGTKDAEENWRTRNKCIGIEVTPEELRLAPGESATVQAEVKRHADGEPVVANIEASTLGQGGTISPDAAHSSPGAPAAFTYTAAPDGSPGSFHLNATSRAGRAERAVRLGSARLEWFGTFTMQGNADIPDVGTSQGTTTFTLRFQADLNEPPAEAGDPNAQRVLIPFELEEDSSMTWSGSATALGITQTFSGSTSNLITPDYADPLWLLALPEGDYLAGEGYIDLSEKKLYLFLVGMGDDTGAGTFNLGPTTDCSFHHDMATNRIYLAFALDDEYKIADGSCWDQVPFASDGQSGIMTQSTRSWHFETRYAAGTQAAP